MSFTSTIHYVVLLIYNKNLPLKKNHIHHNMVYYKQKYVRFCLRHVTNKQLVVCRWILAIVIFQIPHRSYNLEWRVSILEFYRIYFYDRFPTCKYFEIPNILTHTIVLVVDIRHLQSCGAVSPLIFKLYMLSELF